MKSRLSPLLSILLLAAGALFINACGTGSSSAGDTLTQGTFDRFLATSSAFTTLQTSVGNLKAQVAAIGSPAVYIRAPNAPTVQVAPRRTESVGGGNTGVTTQALPSPCNWTLTGRPTSSDPLQSNVYSGITCSKYNFNISAAPTSADSGIIQPLKSANAPVYFDQPGCTGQPYVGGTSGGISGPAMAQGFVIRIDPNNADPTGANPSTYWYLPPGATTVSYTLQSVFNNGTCSAPTPGTYAAYPLLPNDPSVTGIPSAPIPGPIIISQ